MENPIYERFQERINSIGNTTNGVTMAVMLLVDEVRMAALFGDIYREQKDELIEQIHKACGVNLKN